MVPRFSTPDQSRVLALTISHIFLSQAVTQSHAKEMIRTVSEVLYFVPGLKQKKKKRTIFVYHKDLETISKHPQMV